MDQSQDNTNWEYKSDTGQANSASQYHTPTTSTSPSRTATSKQVSQQSGDITWSASEYIHHSRTPVWYVLLIAGTALLAAAVYFLTKDYFGTGIIVALGIIVAVYAGRKPNQITYQLGATSINVGEKSYPYSSFKSFSVIREGSVNSINLLPTKRFMPMVSAYFADADQEKIVTQLGNHLPYEERQPDSIDRLSRRLRF